MENSRTSHSARERARRAASVPRFRWRPFLDHHYRRPIRVPRRARRVAWHGFRRAIRAHCRCPRSLGWHELRDRDQSGRPVQLVGPLGRGVRRVVQSPNAGLAFLCTAGATRHAGAWSHRDRGIRDALGGNDHRSFMRRPATHARTTRHRRCGAGG